MGTNHQVHTPGSADHRRRSGEGAPGVGVGRSRPGIADRTGAG